MDPAFRRLDAVGAASLQIVYVALFKVSEGGHPGPVADFVAAGNHPGRVDDDAAGTFMRFADLNDTTSYCFLIPSGVHNDSARTSINFACQEILSLAYKRRTQTVVFIRHRLALALLAAKSTFGAVAASRQRANKNSCYVNYIKPDKYISPYVYFRVAIFRALPALYDRLQNFTRSFGIGKVDQPLQVDD